MSRFFSLYEIRWPMREVSGLLNEKRDAKGTWGRV
jgi:hypothetical protein